MMTAFTDNGLTYRRHRRRIVARGLRLHLAVLDIARWLARMHTAHTTYG
jgi:hypothetical protein